MTTRQNATEPEFLSQRWPPCMGDCRQGRDCPARADDLGDGEDMSPAEKAQVGCAVVFALCVLGGVIVLVVRGCSS